ncbi:MAG TPA: hypothetical protein DCY94_04570 [Firmicutes bacterium]|nr:hypothetical protein [Bacillota bacterium]
MTVFKTFLKVLYKNKFVVLTYTIFLLIFGVFGSTSNEKTTNFTASKPDIVIDCKDSSALATSLVKYLENNANVKNPDNVDDALFYREINYVMTIEESFSKELMSGSNPKVTVKSTGDYQASLANILLERYIKLARTYQNMGLSEEEVIEKTEDTLKDNTDISLTSKLDTDSMSKMATFYNFSNYPILAGTIYVISFVLTSFKNKNIKKRTIISNMNYKKYNRVLFLGSSLFAIALWIFYVIISIVLLGKPMFSIHGLLYILNSFVFTICALSIAFLISNLVENKEAINGIVNVVALGSSFLCGSFVPMEWLPEGVLKVAHILPSYWFISSNETIKTLEIVTRESMMPLITNTLMLIAFIILFGILSNMISRKKRKIA